MQRVAHNLAGQILLQKPTSIDVFRGLKPHFKD